MPDDGVEVPALVVRGVRVALWLVRSSPAKKIERDDPPAREVWHQPVVEVQIVREAMHKHDCRFLAGVFPHPHAVRSPPYSMSYERFFPCALRHGGQPLSRAFFPPFNRT